MQRKTNETNLRTTAFRFNEIVTDKALVTNQVDRSESEKGASERDRTSAQKK